MKNHVRNSDGFIVFYTVLTRSLFTKLILELTHLIVLLSFIQFLPPLFTCFLVLFVFADKDVTRTDRLHHFYAEPNNANVKKLYDILMTYCMYNFDLGTYLLIDRSVGQ